MTDYLTKLRAENYEKTILVDVDGTLADNDHRQGFLRNHPRQWKQYNALMHLDPPYPDVIWLVKMLHLVGCRIVIVTARQGRSEIRATTKKWLDEVAGLADVYERIYHRDAEDYRDDAITKMEILDQVKADGYKPYMVLDDRNKVVKAWRDVAGLRCLQVQEGDF